MRVLLTGAGGQLGRDLQLALAGEVPPGGVPLAPGHPRRPRSIDVVAADRSRLPIDVRGAVAAVVDGVRPDVIVHAAARTDVDGCEGDRDGAFLVNALGTRHLVEAAGRVGAHLVYISTDYVFDGRLGRPYCEWDEPNPLSVYGASKLAGEHECPPSATVVRTSWLAGVHGDNAVRRVLGLAREEAPLRFVDDQRGSPTFTADLAVRVAALALERLPGTYHVTNAGAATRFELARAVLAAVGADPGRVQAISTADLDPPPAAPRPVDSSLDNAGLRLAGWPALPAWEDGLSRFVAALGIAPGPR
ncbi:MAG TPA: dTDP-4-dehydrorhamnose reductase [Acidimicrobiales bacterium]|nr:dTDP-4-dehydrorhamnose reductase [Acidimicrobiales bacterium]